MIIRDRLLSHLGPNSSLMGADLAFPHCPMARTPRRLCNSSSGATRFQMESLGSHLLVYEGAWGDSARPSKTLTPPMGPQTGRNRWNCAPPMGYKRRNRWNCAVILCNRSASYSKCEQYVSALATLKSSRYQASVVQGLLSRSSCRL